MNFLLAGAYEGAVQVARAAAAVAPPGGGKVLATFRARRGIRARYERWSKDARNTERPLVWMHASSVGEGLQARPVLERLRSDQPHLQLAYTFFSPSAERFARSLDADFAEYLPFDSRGDARAALDALSPRVLAFSKLDVWPALVAAARKRGSAHRPAQRNARRALAPALALLARLHARRLCLVRRRRRHR